MAESFDTDVVADALEVVQEPERVDTGHASVLLEDVMLVEQFDNDFATVVVVVVAAAVLLEDVFVEQFDSGSATVEVVGAGERLEDVQRVESFDTDSRHVAAAIVVVVAEYRDGVQFAAGLLDIDSEAVAGFVVAAGAVAVVEVTALVVVDIVVDTVAADTVAAAGFELDVGAFLEAAVE